MITTEEVLNLNFYKKEKFRGSYHGMRFQLELEKEEGNDHFNVYVWPGPYTFANTAPEKIMKNTFPFTMEGKQQAVDWLNETYTVHQDEWPKSIYV